MLSNEYKQAIQAFQERMGEISIIMERAKSGCVRLYSNLKPFEEKLVKSGWTLCMEMAPYHINEISENIDINMIDDYFYNFYMNDNQAEFKNLQNISKNHLHKNLIKAYEESVFAYEHQKYIICANTLTTILEGTLSCFSDNKSSIKMIKICKEQLSKCSEEVDITRTVWNINLNFIEKLYEKKCFEENEPNFINRHWLMHGRSSFDISDIDCIRLFNAIGNLCCIL